MYFVSQLFIYPVKSLGGIALNQSKIEERGLQYDRRWMLCNEQNEFISQRELKELALFKLQFTNSGFGVQYKNELPFEIPFSINGKTENVKVWDDSCEAIEYKKASDWFSKTLNFTCKLFYMPNETERKVNEKYTVNNEITSFSDGFPILIIGQESLNDLNNKLKEKVEINRFRPNIVFNGGKAFDEDNFSNFSINNIRFKGVKLCARCVVTTINQTTGKSSVEPLKTLATYRNQDNNVMFGKNVIALQANGFIQLNDELKLL
jgi:uncharacterized protein YcbX